MKNEIQSHYREEDIQKLKLNDDIKNWNAELTFMAKEVTFFLVLLTYPFGVEKGTKNQENTNQLLQELKAMDELIKTHTATVLNFNNTLEGLNECEDLQCETYFLNSHEALRDQLKKNGLKYRVLKEHIFSHLEKEITQ